MSDAWSPEGFCEFELGCIAVVCGVLVRCGKRQDERHERGSVVVCGDVGFVREAMCRDDGTDKRGYVVRCGGVTLGAIRFGLLACEGIGGVVLPADGRLGVLVACLEVGV